MALYIAAAIIVLNAETYYVLLSVCVWGGGGVEGGGIL